jgi:hypothetical protein
MVTINSEKGVTTKWMRNTLGGIAKNKEHIAGAVVRTFPSLGWKMPPTRERKPWVSEEWNMAIFDAVAIGLYAFTGLSVMQRQRWQASASPCC